MPGAVRKASQVGVADGPHDVGVRDDLIIGSLGVGNLVEAVRSDIFAGDGGVELDDVAARALDDFPEVSVRYGEPPVAPDRYAVGGTGEAFALPHSNHYFQEVVASHRMPPGNRGATACRDAAPPV